MTEILIVVDDSAHPGAELADTDEDLEWILVGDEVPLDDLQRDELMERLEVRAARAGEREEVDDDEVVEEEEAARARSGPGRLLGAASTSEPGADRRRSRRFRHRDVSTSGEAAIRAGARR